MFSLLFVSLLPTAAAFHSSMAGRINPVLHPFSHRAPAVHAVAPSGIDALPIMEQQLAVLEAFASLGAGTLGFTALCQAAIPDSIGRTATKAGSLLGLLFCLAGWSHFALPEAYQAIYPPQGTWGFWYLPGSAEFHVSWTGVAEFLGGCGLFLGGAADAAGMTFDGRARPVRQLSASALFLLMVAVWPANIYQWTHGAVMVGAGPDGPLDVSYHYVRLVLQVLLLTGLTFLSREEGNAKA